MGQKKIQIIKSIENQEYIEATLNKKVSGEEDWPPTHYTSSKTTHTLRLELPH